MTALSLSGLNSAAGVSPYSRCRRRIIETYTSYSLVRWPFLR